VVATSHRRTIAGHSYPEIERLPQVRSPLPEHVDPSTVLSSSCSTSYGSQCSPHVNPLDVWPPRITGFLGAAAVGILLLRHRRGHSAPISNSPTGHWRPGHRVVGHQGHGLGSLLVMAHTTCSCCGESVDQTVQLHSHKEIQICY